MRPLQYFGRFTILVLLAAASAARGQTVELKSARLVALDGQERERFVEAHNVARRAVKVEPVAWSDELSKYALESLERQKDSLIAEAKEGWTQRRIAAPKHREETEYGENVAAWAGSSGQSAEWAVKWWLHEKAAFEKLNAKNPYRVGDEEGQTETDDAGQEQPIIVGHYTAIVWRTTKQIGAARLDFELADDRGNTRRYAALICNYNPPGNRHGEQPY
jgi:Cysteine-rich secretory protein family